MTPFLPVGLYGAEESIGITPMKVPREGTILFSGSEMPTRSLKPSLTSNVHFVRLMNARLPGTRVRGFTGSRVRGFAGSRVRGFAGFAGFAGSRVRGFARSLVHGFAGSRVRGFAGSRGSRGSRVHGFAGSRVRWFTSSRVRGLAGSRVRGFAAFAGSRVHVLLRAATKHGNVSCVCRG